MTVSVCLPTRGRPERFADMYRSAIETAHGQIEVVAVFDDDDETASAYPKGPTYLTVPAGTNQSGLWSVAWTAATGDVAHMGADDLIYRTEGWDLAVEEAFLRWRDRIGMVYVCDLYPLSSTPYVGQRASDAIGGGYCFAANPFVSREWIEALDGFFTPPYYKSWEADSWIYDVAKSISRVRYLKDVVIEHMHPMADKAPMDETYERGAWGKPVLRRIGWAMSKQKRKERLEQARILTEAIEATRR